MVQTRRQYNHWVANRGDGYQSSQSSQSSIGSGHSNAYDFGGSQNSQDTGPATHAAYSPTDHCKRHRRPDSEPRNKAVRSYIRRAPRS